MRKQIQLEPCSASGLRPAGAHLVLFYLVLDVLQVRPQGSSTHLINPCLRHIQPVSELLQLLVLQVHEDLVESGSERQFRERQTSHVNPGLLAFM